MASTEADKPSPPEYQIQVNRVDAIEAASCLSVALKQMLEKLSGPVVKLGLSLDDLVDKTPFETIQAGIIKLPTVYSREFISVRKLAVDLESRVTKFARMIGVVREPEVGKDERLKVFDRLLDDVKMDFGALDSAMDGFKKTLDELHRLTDSLREFVASVTTQLQTTLDALTQKITDNEKELEALYKELEKVKSEKRWWGGDSTDGKKNRQEIEEKIEKVEKSIRSDKATVSEINDTLSTLPKQESEFIELVKKTEDAFGNGPLQIKSAFENVFSQLVVDIGGVRYAIEMDFPITDDVVSNVIEQYTKIGSALHDLALV